MAENQFEKTEAPTPRRRQEARQEGSVARSHDLTAACTLLAGVVLLSALGQRLLGRMSTMMEVLLSSSHAANPTRPDDLAELGAFALRATAAILLPIMLGLMAVALAVTAGQVGFLLTPKPLMPDPARLSPLRGVRNLFNVRGGMRLIMSLAKLALIVAVALYVIFRDLPQLLLLAQLHTVQAFAVAAQLVYSLALKLAALLLVLAILDYAFQKWQHIRDLRMSKQELKEELKRMEGDPLVKQRRARVARQLAMQRIAQAVPKADVVVTNPTHFAVALQYDAQTMRAPKVIAKGADYLAMRIRQLAALHGVPIIERKPLAQALYRGVEIGQEIPPEHYAAVAEILAYVYRLGNRRSA
ncbi:MAG TPA: flagellar biosynthesis protein FlhB [Phycisphaeraceae bacterium]